MSLRRQLLSSFALQGAGSASVLLATLLLGVSLGPAVQGEFSRTKAEIELIGTLAMFGLPQSLFYYVKSGRLGNRAGMGWGLGSAALAVPIGAMYALLQYPRGWPGFCRCSERRSAGSWHTDNCACCCWFACGRNGSTL